MIKYLFMLVLVASASAQSKNKSFLAAEAKVREGDYKLAIALYSEAITSEPINADFFASRAFAYRMTEAYQKANDDYTMAVKLAPASADMLYKRGLFYLSLNYLDEALKDRDAAVLLSKENDPVRNRLMALGADIHKGKGDYQTAVNEYKAVLENKPEEALKFTCLTNIGAALGKIGKNDEAIAYLEQAVKEFPNAAPVYNNLGFRYMAKGDYTGALQIYDKALALSAKTFKLKDGTNKISKKISAEDNVSPSLLYNNRGYAKLKLGDLSGAMADVNQSIALTADNSYAFRNRALIYVAQNDEIKACEDVKKALDLGFTAAYGDEMQQFKAHLQINQKALLESSKSAFLKTPKTKFN